MYGIMTKGIENRTANIIMPSYKCDTIVGVLSTNMEYYLLVNMV